MKYFKMLEKILEYVLIDFQPGGHLSTSETEGFQNQNPEHLKFPNSVKNRWFNSEINSGSTSITSTVMRDNYKHNRFYHLDCSGKGLSQRCCF